MSESSIGAIQMDVSGRLVDFTFLINEIVCQPSLKLHDVANVFV